MRAVFFSIHYIGSIMFFELIKKQMMNGTGLKTINDRESLYLKRKLIY